ncbi:hypothetical protein C2G38_2277993 [Gigaspora rosea]|uniref:Uncharacterized protein n=1 Tax=Gigaspora rosea TaxID=44941 RepID=A0A397VRM0_9GLOM|nr:hypothetical protein C2G38_2277993 [Gigaspora rosea]
MKQALLYQGLLITIDQVKEPENDFDNAVEHMYDMPQVRLQELLSNIDSNEVQEIWEINHIAASPKPHYVMILSDLTMLCTFDKRIEFGTMMSIAKTSVQVAVAEENNEQHPLGNHVNNNLLDISNPEYHKPRGRPPKCLKSSTEENNTPSTSSSSKTCSYCQEKEHNIRGCKKQKIDSTDKENSEYT